MKENPFDSTESLFCSLHSPPILHLRQVQRRRRRKKSLFLQEPWLMGRRGVRPPLFSTDNRPTDLQLFSVHPLCFSALSPCQKGKEIREAHNTVELSRKKISAHRMLFYISFPHLVCSGSFPLSVPSCSCSKWGKCIGSCLDSNPRLLWSMYFHLYFFLLLFLFAYYSLPFMENVLPRSIQPFVGEGKSCQLISTSWFKYKIIQRGIEEQNEIWKTRHLHRFSCAGRFGSRITPWTWIFFVCVFAADGLRVRLRVSITACVYFPKTWTMPYVCLHIY